MNERYQQLNQRFNNLVQSKIKSLEEETNNRLNQTKNILMDEFENSINNEDFNKALECKLKLDFLENIMS